MSKENLPKIDKRQQKTRQAIFDALGRLLEKTCYHQITVQEIIDEANIGRSTFYAHFETREDLLKAICDDIFHHVLVEDWKKEHSHDFSQSDRNFENRLLHILYHLQDNSKNIRCMLLCEDSELFAKHFKEHLREFFSSSFYSYLKDHKVLEKTFAEKQSSVYLPKTCATLKGSVFPARMHGVQEKKSFNADFKQEVPEDFRLFLSVAAFVDAVQWWLLSKKKYSPEEILQFYLKTLRFI